MPPLSSLLFGKGGEKGMASSPAQPTTHHLRDPLGRKVLGDKPFGKPSSTCVTRVLHSSAPTSFSSPSSSCSSLSCSCSCDSLSSVGGDALKDERQDEDADQRGAIGCGGGDDDDDDEEEEEEEEEGCWGYYGPREGGRKFPPPMRMLAKLENSPRHMPRLFKRSYEDGGRLVIRELKVRHHEYFRAHREDGRLTLKLIHIHEDDDTDATMLDPHHQGQEQQEETEEEEEEEQHIDDHDVKNPDDRDDDQKLSPEIAPPPTSLPSRPLLSPPSLFHTTGKTQDPGDDADVDKIKRNPDVRPWTTSSSMPESTAGGGAQGVCFANGSRRSFFDEPMPMVHVVRS